MCFLFYVICYPQEVSRITSYLDLKSFFCQLINYSRLQNVFVVEKERGKFKEPISPLVSPLFLPLFKATSLVFNQDLGISVSPSVLSFPPSSLSPCLGALGQIWLMTGAKGDPWTLIIKPSMLCFCRKPPQTTRTAESASSAQTHMHMHTWTCIASCKYLQNVQRSHHLALLRCTTRSFHVRTSLVFGDYFDLLQSVIRLIESPPAELAALCWFLI